MALPAVLRMYNKARIDSFSNEVNTITRTAKQQYLLDGGKAQTYTNADGSTNKLNLTGNSNLKYLVEMNNSGKITKLQVTNGEFQYNVSEPSGIDVANRDDVDIVSEIDEEEIIEIKFNPFNFVTRQNLNSITPGDEVSIANEHFIVIDSNSSQTILFAKYNLYVGLIRNDGSPATCSEIPHSDSKYGLQSSSTSDSIGIVPISKNIYWSNSSNIYNSNYNETPIYNNCSITNNNYSIAYYVEEYIDKLKTYGAPSTISGRLLIASDATKLGCVYSDLCYSCSSVPEWFDAQNKYWMGTSQDYHGSTGVYYMNNKSMVRSVQSTLIGLRPVLIVNTSDL